MVLPAPDGPTSATSCPGGAVKVTSCSTCWPGCPARARQRDRLQRRQRHLVGRRVRNDTGRTRCRARRPADRCDAAARSGTASGFSATSGGRSSTSKTRSKLTSAVITSTRTLDSAVSGPYSRPSSAVSATSVPSSNAVDGQDAADAVDHRGGQRGDQGQRDEHGRHIAVHADVPHPGGPAREHLALRRGPPNSLTSSAPATLNRSVIVEPISALSCIDSRVSAAACGRPAGRGSRRPAAGSGRPP